MMYAILLALTFAPNAEAKTLSVEIISQPPLEVDMGTEEVRNYATGVAMKYDLDVDQFLKTLYCENTFHAKGQSSVENPSGPNGHEDSWGAVQIHLPDHKEITKEQAEDPHFAIPWMAEQWKGGNARWWSCWKRYEEIGWEMAQLP